MDGVFDKLGWEKKYMQCLVAKPQRQKLLAKPKGRWNYNETGS